MVGKVFRSILFDALVRAVSSEFNSGVRVRHRIAAAVRGIHDIDIRFPIVVQVASLMELMHSRLLYERGGYFGLVENGARQFGLGFRATSLQEISGLCGIWISDS